MRLIKISFIINLIFISNTIQNQLSKTDSLEVAGQWCCKIEPEIETILQTRQTTYYVLRHERHKCGYVGCGILNLGRCTKWCSETWAEAVYGQETYTVNRTLPCPQSQLGCCPQNVFVLGHCISYEEIFAHQSLLMELNDLNIVSSGFLVG